MTRQSRASGEWTRENLETVLRCPVCGSRDRALLHDGLRDLLFAQTPGEWTLRGCRDCGAGYLDPRPDLASVGRAYLGYYTHGHAPTEAASNSRWGDALRNGYLNARYGYSLRPALPLPEPLLPPRLRLKTDRSIRHLCHPGSVSPRLLDLGCGNGAFVSRMQSLGWEAVGLEPDLQAVRAAREAGLAVEHGFLTESRFPDEVFDAVTMNHVIEHLHDPLQTLEWCHRILRSDGVLWIATPNLASLGHDRFGPAWRGLEPPRHLVLFTADALRRALRKAGFEQPATLLRGMRARWMYRSSAKLREGEERLSVLERMRLKWHAGRADFRARSRPDLAEEIVLLSRKR